VWRIPVPRRSSAYQLLSLWGVPSLPSWEWRSFVFAVDIFFWYQFS
jgi:hypothetical protein